MKPTAVAGILKIWRSSSE